MRNRMDVKSYLKVESYFKSSSAFNYVRHHQEQESTKILLCSYLKT